MFTPPPSPLPQAKFAHEFGHDISTTLTMQPLAAATTEAKLATRRRTKWSILLVPIVLIVITLSTRYVSHPAAFDAFTDPASNWPASLADWSQHTPHKRSPQAVSLSNPLAPPTSTPPPSSSIPTPTTSTSQTQQTIPSVPSSPPVLPTPFPQPFDSTLSSSVFSTQGCSAFFTNMTQTEPFRTCRPFSLLQLASQSFLEAQANLTELNTILWGTCNTDTSQDQCIANMGWFAEELQIVCKIDLQDGVAMASNGLIGLQAYSVMRTAGCQVDQTSSAYCYLEAAHNANPSDSYFYGLPLGSPLPNSTVPSCDACTKTVMMVYGQGKQNVTALQKTFDAAAVLAQDKCGAGYVEVLTSSSRRSTSRSLSWVSATITLIIMVVSCVS